MTSKAASRKPVLRVRPYSYQPKKKELEEDVRIEATPEELARAILRPVTVVEDTDA